MKKSLSILALALLIVMLFSTVAFAMPARFHPPVRRLDLPSASARGLHIGCENLPESSIAAHVFLFMLAPENHRPNND